MSIRALSPVMTIIFGLFYGAFVASAYLFARLNTQDGGLVLFGAMSIAAFLGHFLIWPKLILRGLRDREMVLRGLLYGIMQALILKAQSSGFTSTALVASSMGSVFGVLLGRIILKEKIQGYALIAAAFCFAAIFLNPMQILSSYWGIIGGFTQGLVFVLARSLMVGKKSIRQSIGVGYLLSAFVMAIVLAVSGDLEGLKQVSIKDLQILGIIAVTIQYGFFFLCKMLDTQRASLLTLSRLPWAFTLEYAIVGSLLSATQLLAGGLITIGSFFLFLDAKKKLSTPP